MQLFTFVSKFWNISALVVSVDMQYKKAWSQNGSTGMFLNKRVIKDIAYALLK